MSRVERLERKRLAERRRRRDKRSRWETFTDWARARGTVVLEPAVRLVKGLGVHPNTITVTGALLQVGVGVLFGLGYVVLGGWLLLVVAPLDALDGALARAVGKESRFGAFLDSTLDRFSDAALILGLTARYVAQQAHLEVALLLVSLVAALMVSYIRAKAEALGFSCKVGLLTRLERILLIGLLSALGLPDLMAWMLAVLSVITVVQRIVWVYFIARQEDRGL